MAVNALNRRWHSYEGMTDEQVVAHAKRGSLWATEYILCKYRQLVEAKARAYFLLGAEHEDIIQEGMIGLLKAIRDFVARNGVVFRAFAELCVTRQIISAVKTACRHKHSLLNYSISVEGCLAAGEEETALREWLPAERPSDPETLFLRQEFNAEVEGQMQRILSPLEAEALRRYLEGKSYREIAYELACRVKQVDNALQRAKKKMAHAIALSAVEA